MQISSEFRLPDSSEPGINKDTLPILIGSAIVLVLVLLSYTRTFLWLSVDLWYEYQDYVYGFFVVPFSGFLLWDRRDMLKGIVLRISWWSIPCFLIGVSMRIIAIYRFTQVLEALSMIPILAGLVLFVGGWQAMKWSWSAIAFLVFMIPLPSFLAGAFSQVLQRVGTGISVFTLQTLGMPAVADGNVIVLSNARLGVVEACSGIRMLMLFFAACVGAAFLLRHRDLLTRILIILSAIF